MQTAQLSSSRNASKRAVDTEVLMIEFVHQDPRSRRALDAVARVNFLHAAYRRAGRISNDDMLYTLGLFALEPGRWIDRYEWRTLTDVERCAFGVFWRDVAGLMEIDYKDIERFGDRKDREEVAMAMADGLSWLQALDRWTRWYEQDKMVPAKSNRDLSRYTMDVAVFNIPRILRRFAMGVLSALLEARLRTGMMLDHPSLAYRVVASVAVTTRKWVIRYLCLPRFEWFRVKYVSDEMDPKTGKYHTVSYNAHPYYVSPTLLSRWSPGAVIKRLLGGVAPGDEGDKYIPDGYDISRLGPDNMVGKGEAEMARNMEVLADRRGCPMFR